MKNIFTVIFAITFFGLQAQEESSTGHLNKHEFRLDALEILAFTNLDISYEYVISKYSGVGASLAISLGNEDQGFSEYQSFAFSPYFRQYFLNKKEYGARGLFVEGLMKFATGDGYDDVLVDGSIVRNNDDWFNIGVGLSIGQKWVSENGFVFEISAGGGRYFIDNNQAPEGFFRGGILIGYRFF